ncbi:DUF3575 domain-containing protein [Polaribacter sp.]|nr:DUF3575 domain-containing protein [Polaribacter sp.]
MKKIVFGFVLLSSAFSFAQQEVKLDIADALVIRSIEVSYERILNEESSIGISALFNLADQDIDFRYNENVMITPFYRHYFTNQYKWNFFGEGFLGINSGKRESEKDSNVYDIEYTDAALGVAVGTKYVSNGGLIIDIYGGLGRNLFGTDSPTLVPRIGLNVGWRF